MTSSFRYFAVCALFCLGLAALPLAQAPAATRDPLEGTWRLNVAKSNMGPRSASSSETIVFKVTGNEESFESHAVQARDGAKEHTGYKATYGGPPAPMASIYVLPNGVVSRVDVAMVQVMRISDRTRERKVTNLEGRQVLWARREISEDGKTINASLLDADGKPIRTRFFDRVE